MMDLLNTVAQVSAERMIDSLAIGLALAVFAWTLLRVIPRQNSATRFAVWFAALTGTAVFPLLDAGVKPAAERVSPALHAVISVPSSWALYVFAIWAVVAAMATLRVGIGIIELRRLRRSCRPIEITAASWQETVARFCPGRRVEVLTSDYFRVPTAIGFDKPAVVIPSGLLKQLSPAELNQVLLHELAHLRRWDEWTNVVQKLVKATMFFHPAVWWMEQRISLEREMACDDAVLAETQSPRAYAECLANLAEKSFVQRSAALAQAAVHRVRQTRLRVAQILDVNRPKAPAGKSVFALLGVLACAFTVIVWHAPRLVAFQDPPPPTTTGSANLAQIAVAPLNDLGARSPSSAIFTRVSKNVAQPVLPHAVVLRAKAATRAVKINARQPQPLNVVAQPNYAARMMQAKASAQPTIRTGVVVIFVDDPVFGPTPILWRFAVWQVTPAQPGSQVQPATPHKSI